MIIKFLIVIIILIVALQFRPVVIATTTNTTVTNMSNDSVNQGIQTLNITGSLNVTNGQGHEDSFLTATSSILPIVGTIAGTLLGAFSTYFIQKEIEERKNMLENLRKKEYASVILQISTKELNNYKTILAKIRTAGIKGRTESNKFDDDEYFIAKDADLDKIQNEINRATNLYSKLPLENRTSIFLTYLNSVDSAYSAYEHLTKSKFELKYGYKGVYPNAELAITINKIDTALIEIGELTRIQSGK